MPGHARSWKPVQSEIEDRFDAYLEQERRVHRGTMVDDRIHCCLYFIPPSGHGYGARTCCAPGWGRAQQLTPPRALMLAWAGRSAGCARWTWS